MKVIAGEMNPMLWQALAPHMTHLPQVSPVPPFAAAPRLQQHTLTVHGIELDCRMEFEAGAPSSFDEPGYPDEYRLVHAFVKGVDVMPLLTQALIEQIEARAACS